MADRSLTHLNTVQPAANSIHVRTWTWKQPSASSNQLFFYTNLVLSSCCSAIQKNSEPADKMRRLKYIEGQMNRSPCDCSRQTWNNHPEWSESLLPAWSQLISLSAFLLNHFTSPVWRAPSCPPTCTACRWQCHPVSLMKLRITKVQNEDRKLFHKKGVFQSLKWLMWPSMVERPRMFQHSIPPKDYRGHAVEGHAVDNVQDHSRKEGFE